MQRLLDIAAAARAPVIDTDLILVTAGQPAVGSPEAGIVIAEFFDFQCGFCRRYTAETLPQLMAEYVDSGRVRLLFYDYPVANRHPHAPRAAEAARCGAEQDRYQALRTLFFEHSKALQPQFLSAHAEAAGLDIAAFEACVDSGRHAAAVAADLAQGTALGVRGTPTFFVGVPTDDGAGIRTLRRIAGAQPYTVFRDVIEQLAADAAVPHQAGQQQRSAPAEPGQ